MIRRATEPEIAAALGALPGWERRGETIWQGFTFADFAAAFAFMADVARIAEALDHHPDWRNVHRRVEISLSTHDARGLTGRDFRLAREISALADARGAGR